MLGWRLFLSAVLIPAFAGLFYLDARAGETAPVLFALALVLALRATWELVELFRTRSFQPRFMETAALAVAIVAAGWYSHIWPRAFGEPASDLQVPMLVYALAVLWLLASNAARYRGPGNRMETLGAELVIISYVGVLLCLTSQLRWVAGANFGYLVLGSVIVAAKCGDIGAYTAGRLFGRRKMSPLLSPGKTWAGAAGGLLGAAAGSWFWLHEVPRLLSLSRPPTATLWALIYGIVIGIAGMIGDLCESLIKRDLGKKDAAALMPGFGGLLDLLDSVLYAAPVAYVLWKALPL